MSLYRQQQNLISNLKRFLNNLNRSKFTSTTSTLDPVKLAYASYESTGSNETVLTPLIVNHGLFGSKSNWNSLCKVYQNKTNRKVIAVDARNHGDSPHSNDHSYEHLAADLKELMKQLYLEKASFLGHSMGGRAVMYFALQNVLNNSPTEFIVVMSH